MIEEMLKYLSEYVNISDKLRIVIIENDLIRTFGKGTVLLKEGQIANECYFVLKGCIKTYYNCDGEEKITGFYTEGHVVTPVSYIDKLPSKYLLSCVECTTVYAGNHSIEKSLYDKYPELESLIRLMVEKLMATSIQSFDDRDITSPEDRYIELLKRRPDLFQRVPQYQFASYLGIKPQSLSRLKKRLVKKNSK